MKERRALAGGMHIVVGTPGRLRDHLERGALDLSSLRVAVLDEADEMLDMGFREELEEILDATPQERRTLLFSATMPRPIVALAKRYQKTRCASRPLATIRGIRTLPTRPWRCHRRTSRRRGQPASFPRGGDDDPLLRDTRGRAPAPREPYRTGLRSGGAIGRAQPERTQSRASGAAGPARAGLRRYRCCRARNRPAIGLTRDSRRAAAGRRSASTSVRPHRPRGTQRNGDPDRTLSAAQAGRRMLRGARISAEWIAPPTAAEIRAKDRERLLAGLAAPVELEDEDHELAQQLLEKLGPEAIAAALVKSLRKDCLRRRTCSRQASDRSAGPMRAYARALKVRAGSGSTPAAATMLIRAGCSRSSAVTVTSAGQRSARSGSPPMKATSRSASEPRLAS